MKQIIKENSIVVFFRILWELFNELLQLKSSLGIVKLHKNRNKYEALILKKYHSVEKGLSLPNPRPGFGEKKVFDLISEITYYNIKYPESNLLKFPIAALKNYCDFNKENGYRNHAIENKINNLCNNIDLNGTTAGVKLVHKKEILDKVSIDFSSLVFSRHSIRQYKNEDVSIETIKRALKIANQSPSACNRQPWHTYVFKGEKKDKLLNFQGGCRGFEGTINTAILVTSDLNCFDINEIHQAYIDGGLYSMSLIYAIHSLGLGSIPLTTGFKRIKLNKFYKTFNVPNNQVPIVIVGIGHLPETFSVACSNRKDISETNCFV